MKLNAKISIKDLDIIWKITQFSELVDVVVEETRE